MPHVVDQLNRSGLLIRFGVVIPSLAIIVMDPKCSTFNMVREIVGCSMIDGCEAIVWLPNYCDACHCD